MEQIRKSSLRMILDVPFSKFDRSRQNGFLKDLGNLIGAAPQEFSNVKFRDGCVIFDAELPASAVQRLIELVELSKSKENLLSSEERSELSDFLKKYKVKTGSIDHGAVLKITVKSAKHKIFFVHGWRGNSESFGDMPEQLERNTGRKSFVYEYPSGIFSNSPSINLVYRNLENFIHNAVDGTNTPFSIIAHSMGGIVVRKLLSSQLRRKRRLDKLTDLVVFAASPRTGVPFAKLQKFIPSPLIQKNQLFDITPDSSNLVELMADWRHFEIQKKKTEIRNIFGSKDQVIDIVNMSNDDPEAIPFLDRDHFDIVKPRADNDEVVSTLSRLISELKI